MVWSLLLFVVYFLLPVSLASWVYHEVGRLQDAWCCFSRKKSCKSSLRKCSYQVYSMCTYQYGMVLIMKNVLQLLCGMTWVSILVVLRWNILFFPLKGLRNNRAAFSPEVLEAYKYMFSQNGLTCPLNYYRKMFNSSNGKLLKKEALEMPVLIIWVRWCMRVCNLST